MTLYRTRLTDFHYMGGRRHSLVYERMGEPDKYNKFTFKGIS